MTLQEIDEMAITEPYCFENEQEEQWYKVGLREGADAAIEQLGWHPASELPPVDKNGESEYLIAYDLDGYAFSAFYSRKKGWCDDDGRVNLEIEWWGYPPNKV